MYCCRQQRGGVFFEGQVKVENLLIITNLSRNQKT